jgi:ABC-2 type transport system ATP-binding protein
VLAQVDGGGPNGAGKTTTIRVIATLLEPMAGRVEVDGYDVSIDPHEVRRIIGYVPDYAGVYERVTVREYLEFFADAYRIPHLGVIEAVLELTDLEKLQDRLVDEMSKGMKQRLQLARVLLHDPNVLVLDEPASDLDPRARIEMRDLLLELCALGKTIFLSSHILTELADVCTSVAILERGQLVVAGPIAEIAVRLEQRRLAMALGHMAPPMVGTVPLAPDRVAQLPVAPAQPPQRRHPGVAGGSSLGRRRAPDTAKRERPGGWFGCGGSGRRAAPDPDASRRAGSRRSAQATQASRAHQRQPRWAVALGRPGHPRHRGGCRRHAAGGPPGQRLTRCGDGSTPGHPRRCGGRSRA